MIETKDYLRELGSYLFMGILVGALYGGNVYCGSLNGKKRIAEAATLQREEKIKHELEACIYSNNGQEKMITLDDVRYNKECYLKFLDSIEKR